jgi:hypothetical protein
MAQETTGTTPKTYNLTHPRNGRRVTVTGLSPLPPTQEEVDEIFSGVYGEGMLTKMDIPSLTAAPTSIGASTALGTAAKKIWPIAALTGTAGALGEVSKQLQTPSRVGDWNITSIEEPAWMGATTRTYNPQSVLSRGKNVVMRGLEEGGLDIVGAGLMQIPRAVSRGLQTMAMGSERLPFLQAESGEQIIEQSLREGIGPVATRAGRRWLPHDTRVGGTVSGKAIDEIEKSADSVDVLIASSGGGSTPLVDVGREGSFFDDIISRPGPVRGRTLGEHLQILDDANLQKPLQDFRDLGFGKVADDMGALLSRYITDPDAQRAARELDASVSERIGRQPFEAGTVRPIPGTEGAQTMPAGETQLWGDFNVVDVHGAKAILPRPQGLTSAADISLTQALHDKRFLEQTILPPLYAKIKDAGTAATATRAQLVAQAIRDALDARIKSTLKLGEATGQMRPGTLQQYEAANLRTQQIHKLLEMVEASPHLSSSPFSLLAPTESLLARGIEKGSRYGYAAPQNILRGMQVGQLDNPPPRPTTIGPR